MHNIIFQLSLKCPILADKIFLIKILLCAGVQIHVQLWGGGGGGVFWKICHFLANFELWGVYVVLNQKVKTDVFKWKVQFAGLGYRN